MIKKTDLKIDNARYEKKFVTRMPYYEIERIIRLNPALFLGVFKERKINNIYLDGIDYKNYFDNLNGNSSRFKIRIRWYGETFGKIEPRLELKIKNGEFGWKFIFPLKPFKLDNNFSAKFLQEEVLMKSKLPDWLAEQIKFFYPALLNFYKRKYFVSADGKYRITLDREMVFYRIKKNNNTFREKIIDNEHSIVELKYKRGDYKEAHWITQNLPFRISANSKYIKGIDVLSL